MRCRFLYGGRMENYVQQAAIEYDKVCKKQYHYTFDNGQEIKIVFKPQNFAHLAGLRKLNDLNEFQPKFPAKIIFQKALAGEITPYDLQRSEHYDTDARERVENLCRLSSLLQTDKAVYGFDAKKSPISSRLKSEVVFFHEDGYNFYLMLGVAKDGVTYYPETFFLRFDDAYIKGQNIVHVESLETIDQKHRKEKANTPA